MRDVGGGDRPFTLRPFQLPHLPPSHRARPGRRPREIARPPAEDPLRPCSSSWARSTRHATSNRSAPRAQLSTRDAPDPGRRTLAGHARRRGRDRAGRLRGPISPDTPTSCGASRRPSALGAWSYEAQDTKLARETKGGTILQLCGLLRHACAAPGDAARSVFTSSRRTRRTGSEPTASPTTPRTTAWFATLARDAFTKGHERLLDDALSRSRSRHATVPLGGAMQAAAGRRPPVVHRRCRARASHRAGAQGHATLAAAATMPVPVTFKPSRGSRETYEPLGDRRACSISSA